tara:strand:- start:309 stop:485 length:177 start_codon:yes stop_codon:yes gene_type:complete
MNKKESMLNSTKEHKKKLNKIIGYSHGITNRLLEKYKPAKSCIPIVNNNTKTKIKRSN